MRNSKLFGLAVAATLLFAAILTSCGDGGLPNGHYVPVNPDMTMVYVQKIIIKGDNFKVVYPFEGNYKTLKYKYADGILTLIDRMGATAGQPCEFKNDTLWFAGIQFVKMK